MHTALIAVVLVAVIAGFGLLAHLVRFKGEYVDRGL